MKSAGNGGFGHIDSLKIFLKLPFMLNSSESKALCWVKYYVNCHVYFNC